MKLSKEYIKSRACRAFLRHRCDGTWAVGSDGEAGAADQATGGCSITPREVGWRLYWSIIENQ